VYNSRGEDSTGCQTLALRRLRLSVGLPEYEVTYTKTGKGRSALPIGVRARSLVEVA